MMDEYLFEISNALLIDISMSDEEVLRRDDLWSYEEDPETIPFL